MGPVCCAVFFGTPPPNSRIPDFLELYRIAACSNNSLTKSKSYFLPRNRCTAKFIAIEESPIVEMYTGTSNLYAAARKLFSGLLAFSVVTLPIKLHNSALVNDLSTNFSLNIFCIILSSAFIVFSKSIYTSRILTIPFSYRTMSSTSKWPCFTGNLCAK